MRAIAEQVSDEPWAAAEISRTLSSLGHIDFQLHAQGLRPEQWAITPTTIALVQGGVAVVCGGRSERLRAALSEACVAAGAHLVVEAQDSAPDRWSIHSGHEVAAEIAKRLTRVGVQVGVARDPGLDYAKALPKMGDVANLLKNVSAPLGVPTKRFDWHANTWVEHTGLITPGAYRYLTQPPAYGVAAPGGQPGMVLSVDNRWSKWIAASLLGWGLLAYDPKHRTLICALGAQLPGLYERAAVLSSGWAPQPMQDVTVHYRDVPKRWLPIFGPRLPPTLSERPCVSTASHPESVYAAIRDAYLRYYDTAFRLRDRDLAAERRPLLDELGTIFTDPIIEPLLPYAASTTIAEVCTEIGLSGTIAADLGRMLFNADSAFALRQHQADAMLAALGKETKHNPVVTAGTGSGKTESFLLPVFGRL